MAKKKCESMTLDRFIEYCLAQWPELRREPDFQIVSKATSMRDVLQAAGRWIISRQIFFESLAILIPSQREFWLRCEASDGERWLGGMMYLFSTENEPIKPATGKPLTEEGEVVR